MSEIRITVPTTSTTKQEEIETIEKLQKSFAGTGSYLASLFSEKMVAWVAEQIRNDFIPDLYGAFMFTEEEAGRVGEAARSELRQAEAEIKRLTSELSMAQESRDRQATMKEQYKGLYETTSQQLVEMNGERNQAVADLEAANQKIIELKARLFDLLVK